MLRLACLASLLALVVAGPRAQDAWRLPPDSAAIYRRTAEWEPVALDEGASVSFGGHEDHVPPVLLASELEPDGLRVARPVCDLHDVFPWLAFDLTTRKAGRVDRVFRRVPWIGDVHVTGRAERPRGDGTQELRLTIRSLREMDLSGASPEFARALRWYFDERIEGELTIVRAFDAQRGVVERFRAELDAEIVDETHGDEGTRRFGLSGAVTWELDRLEERDAEFRARVDDAVALAIEHERAVLAAHEHPVLVAEEGRGNVQGPTFHAMLLFSLARAGVGYRDPVVAESLERFAGREFSHTNTLALAVLAVDALHASPTERASLVAGEVTGAPQRRLPARERSWIEKWTARILADVDASAWADGRAYWRFVPDGYADVFTTWLALQALDAAERCGVEVPNEVWPAAARWLLDGQRATGELVAEPVRYLRGGRSSGPVEAAGWNGHCRDDWESCHGSATAQALAALALCRRHMSGELDQVELVAAVQTSIERGLAWLADGFTTRFDPSPHPVYWQWGDELRLSLPFALEELGVVRLGGSDWYFEGACCLLAGRNPDGAMGDSAFGTAAALAFLRRTPKGPVTGWQGR